MADGQSWTRGYIGWLLDHAIGWAYGYPPETCDYRAAPMRIPVSSGLSRIELAADSFTPLLPEGVKPKGTILVRSPYGRGLPLSLVFARIYASRGYHVLCVSCRGTFGSGGDFDPCRTEVEDGKAVVEWMRAQPWYTGTFATIGSSYLGFTQWALLTDPPEDMVAAVVIVGPHDMAGWVWQTGALNMDIIRWGYMVSEQDRPNSRLRKWIDKLSHRDPFRSVMESIPLVQGVMTALAGKVPWLETIMTTSDMKDPFYADRTVGSALDRANIPILLISGWHDPFSEQSMEQYFRLRARGCPVALTVGPWDHSGGGATRLAPQQMLGWLETYLAKSKKTDRPEPVYYHVTGAKEWRWASTFPPSTRPFTLHLHPDNKLHFAAPMAETASSAFIFDPSNPTPTIGGDILRGKAGSVDDSVLSSRSDVLSFTTEPLDADTEFVGKATVTLAHSTDSPYADIFVRICEVDANGKSHNICEGYQRLDPERDMETTLTVSLRWCAHRFMKGKRIRLLVAGGCFPHYTRNLGVANVDNRGSEWKRVKHTVQHSATMRSSIVLPRC
jgi:putative CocE/NonD family hydrolase